jgi:hypothetical protein
LSPSEIAGSGGVPTEGVQEGKAAPKKGRCLAGGMYYSFTEYFFSMFKSLLAESGGLTLPLNKILSALI